MLSRLLRKDNEIKLQTLEVGCHRQMIGMTRRDRVRNDDIINSIELDNTVIDIGWLGGITVRALDLRSSGLGFYFQSGRYQAT